jgi:hypothetical protein
MSAHQELSNFMWGICGHVFRSLLKPHEYGEAIPPFVILNTSLFDLKRLKQDLRSNGLNFDNFFNDFGFSETG